MTLDATITPEQAARDHWDVIVIGGGPAGALAARGLVRRKLKTLLVDRKAFPRSKVCGCCISRRGLSLLDCAGLTAQIDALEGVPLTRVQVLTKSQQLAASLPRGVAISRFDLDETLVRSSIAEGVQFVPGLAACVRPEKATPDRQVRTVDLTSSRGTSFSLESSIVVAADGLGHPSLRDCPEFVDRVRRHSRMGLGTTIATEAPGFESGSVTLSVGRAGYVGAVRLRSGYLHLAASVDQLALRSRNHPAELVSQVLQDAGLPLIPEVLDADWQGTVPFTRRTSRVAGSRVFLVGDAAGYVEPFTGEGITWALATGMAVPAFIEQAIHHSSKIAETGWQACYQNLIRRRQDWCRLLAWALRRPRLVATVVRFMNLVPALPQFLVNKFNQPIARTEWDFA